MELVDDAICGIPIGTGAWVGRPIGKPVGITGDMFGIPIGGRGGVPIVGRGGPTGARVGGAIGLFMDGSNGVSAPRYPCKGVALMSIAPPPDPENIANGSKY